jgi:phospholipid/cholesterol/gamma-HCH transport system substrate-binding protein
MPAGVRQGRRVAIGAAIIVALIAAAIIIFYLDAIVASAQEEYRIVGIFYEAPRLREGSPVRVAGYQVGQVTRIELLPPGGESIPPFAATLQLPTRIRDELRRDSRIRLQRQQYMGESLVELTPGTITSPVLQPWDTLYAEPPLEAAGLVTRARVIRNSIDTLLQEEETLRARTQPLGAIAHRLRAELGSARDEFRRFERDFDTGPLPAFLRDSTERRALERVADLAGEIADLARARLATLEEAGYRPALESLAHRAEMLREEVVRLRALLEEPRGFPGRWERDPALREAVERTRAHLDSLIELTRRKPWRYFF